MSSLRTCRACTRALLAPSRTPASARTVALISSHTFSSQSRRSYATEPKATGGVRSSIASKIRDRAPIFTETYVAYGACDELIKECARPGAYSIPQAAEKGGEIPTDENGTHIGVGSGWWYDSTFAPIASRKAISQHSNYHQFHANSDNIALGLKPTYLNWTQITFLHMWLLQVRFRMLPATHSQTWIEHLTNHAFYAAEDRLVVYHKFTQASLRQKYLKDTFAQWRAVLLSYDEGLVKGDAVLAAAVWRNLFGAREDVDFEKLAQIVSYMRRELQRLDRASDDDVVKGEWKFKGDPGEEASVVKRTSPMGRGGQ